MVSTPPASPSTHVPNSFPDPNWTNFLEDDVLTPQFEARRSRHDLPDHPVYFEPDLFCPEDSLADTLEPVSSADNTLDMPSSPLLDFPHPVPPLPAPSTSWCPPNAGSYSPPRWRSFMDQDCPLRKRVKVTITRMQTSDQGASGCKAGGQGLNGIKAQEQDWMWTTKLGGESGAIGRERRRCGAGKRRKGVSAGRVRGGRKPGVRRGRFGSGMLLYFGEMEEAFWEDKAKKDVRENRRAAAGRRKKSRLSCADSNSYLKSGLGAGSRSRRPTNYLDLMDDLDCQSPEIDDSTGQIMVNLQPTYTYGQRKPSTFTKRFAAAARQGHISGALRMRLDALMTRITCEEVLESHIEHRTAVEGKHVLPEFESAVRAVEDAATNYSSTLGKKPESGPEETKQERNMSLNKEGKERRQVWGEPQSKGKRVDDEMDEFDMDPASSALQRYLESPVRHIGGRHRVVAP